MTRIHSVIPPIFFVVLSKAVQSRSSLRPPDFNPCPDANGPHAR